MARQVTCGFEVQVIGTNAEGYSSENYSGAPTIGTVSPRSGAACLNCGSGAARYVEFNVTGSNNVAQFSKAAFRRGAAPSAQIKVLLVLELAHAEVASVRLETNGDLNCYDGAGTVIGSAFPTSINTYYVVELKISVPASGGTSNGTIEWRVNGAVQGSSTTANTGTSPPALQRFGKDIDGGISILVDDVAINDATGTTEDGYPGPGHVALLKPASDSTRVGWVGGAGGTTNLFDAVNNTPPIGVAVGAPSTNLTQIEDANNNSTDAFTAVVTSPTTAVASGGAGMKTGDIVRGIYGIARGGNSTTTQRTLAVAVPGVVAETTMLIPQAIAAATEPTGWYMVINPFTSVGSPPSAAPTTVKIRKGTASTDTMTYDLMGLMIEWNDSGGIVATSRMARNTLLRR